jgi:hypothetical protein
MMCAWDLHKAWPEAEFKVQRRFKHSSKYHMLYSWMELVLIGMLILEHKIVSPKSLGLE